MYKMIKYVEIGPEQFAFHNLVYITWSLFFLRNEETNLNGI